MRLITFISLLVLSTLTCAQTLNKIVVFGDSLSDNGNLYREMQEQLPQSPPYFKGRFSNGPVWVEHLIDLYYPNDDGRHLEDYAFGGADVDDEDDDVLFTLQRQVNDYLHDHEDKADPNSLFIVWIGANNYLDLPEDAESATKHVVTLIKKDLDRLIEHGAKTILLLNLPDLGKTPAAVEFGTEEAFTTLSLKHNELLKGLAGEIAQQHPDITLLTYDVNHMFNNMLNNPEQYGFSNTTGTCYEAVMDDEPSKDLVLRMASLMHHRLNPNACDGYLFFDPVHPTAPAHVLMANEARKVLDENHIIFEDKAA